MNNIPLIIDLSIAAVLLFFIIFGACRGFFKTVFSFIHGVAAGVIAYLATPYVTGFVKKTSVYTDFVEKAKNAIYETVKGFLETEVEKLPENAGVNSLFERFGSSVDFIREEYIRLTNEKIADAVRSVTEYVVSPACSVLLTVLSFLLLFIISLVLLYFVMKLFEKLKELPALKTCDRLLGAILGAVAGCIVVFLLISAFEAVLPFAVSPTDTVTIRTFAQGSYLYGIFTAVNPLTILFALIA